MQDRMTEIPAAAERDARIDAYMRFSRYLSPAAFKARSSGMASRKTCGRVRDHGAALEAEVRRDARFRWALGCIWLSHGSLPRDVLRRIVDASGGAIDPLPGR